MSTYVSTQSAEKLLQYMMTQYCNWPSVYPDMKKLREVLIQLSDEQKLHILHQKYSGSGIPLDYAANRGHTEIVSTLLSSVTQRYSGSTPLVCAAERDHTKMISTLLTSLQSSANRLKLLMVDKYTPLHYAAFCCHTESVKTILDCLTADQQKQIMSVQRSGKTAIQLAERHRHTDTVRILREYQHRADNLMREEYSKLIINLCPPPYQSMCQIWEQNNCPAILCESSNVFL